VWSHPSREIFDVQPLVQAVFETGISGEPTHILPLVARTGDLVRVRQRRWRVISVRAYDTCQLLTLAGAEPGNALLERHIVAPFDSVEAIGCSERLRTVGLGQWRRACRALLAANLPAGALEATRDARIDLFPHQLEPALAVVRGLGLRVLLSDEVGLGKTIQAGIIIAELRARHMADRVLLLTPAGLRDQWAQELRTRFALPATVVDAVELRRRVTMLAAGTNPWTTFPVAIASIEWVKRPEVLPPIEALHWDVLVIDEAHRVGSDSDRHRAVTVLAARTRCVLLVTATPHSGDPRTFEALCRVGGSGDRLLVFRRTRAEVHVGARRRVHLLQIRLSASEALLQELLDDFSRTVRAERGDSNLDVWLALFVLHKRAWSSARSLELSILRRLEGLDPEAAGVADQVPLPFPDEESKADPTDQSPPWSPHLELRDRAREAAMLRTMLVAARESVASETKLQAVMRLLRRVHEPVIIFTEYRDTLLHIRDALKLDAAVLHGGLSRAERESEIEAFVGGRRPVLLATDAGSEGLNLHHTCRTVINLELPWNPVRLEHRIGRADRIGQRRTVHAFHLISRGTGEARILERLRCRIARARQDVGAADPVDGADEERVARLILGSASDPTKPPNGDTPSLAPEPGTSVAPSLLTTVDLAREAAEEASRLAAARTLVRESGVDAHSQQGETGPRVTRCRNPHTRARLGNRVLLLLRSADEDVSGLVTAWTLVPVAVTLPSAVTAFKGPALDDFVRSVRLVVDSHVERAARDWRTAAHGFHLALIESMHEREQSGDRTRSSRSLIHGASGLSGLFQPGLFDRRAEARHNQGIVTIEEARDETRRRLAALERSSVFTSRSPELLLVLAP
jgi:superfamily II DNA or RNA helicase